MRLTACLLLVLFLGMPVASTAQQDALSLEQAVKRVKEQSDVRVLSAERVRSEGRTMYRIKVLTPEGRVRHIWVDPAG